MVLLSLSACLGSQRVMRTGIAPDPLKADAEVRMMFVPAIFDGDPLLQEALNCAAMYNNAVQENRSCAGWNTTANSIIAVSTITAAASTGVASQVTSDGAKAHWTMAALTAAAVAVGISAFDNWLNCKERTIREHEISQQRLIHLHNAAHLLACARGVSKRGKEVAAADKLPEPLACQDSREGKPVARPVPELRDMAHAELAKCFAGDPTGYGSGPPAAEATQPKQGEPQQKR